MNTILLYLFMTPLSPVDSTQTSPTDVTEYYNDSLRLYNVYAYQISYLKNIKETDTAKWNAKAIHDHLVTCGTQRDLSHHNQEIYAPTDSFKRAGCETAYAYPKPVGNKLRYVVYDEQTRFTKKPNGQTDMPYIIRMVFDLDADTLMFEEKLNPITRKKLP